MHIRLVFALALFFVSIFGGYGVRPAHADFCTVEQIMGGVRDEGATLKEVLEFCTELDVSACTVKQVYSMVELGFSLSDIYYECG
jgi:hypothetical protein